MNLEHLIQQLTEAHAKLGNHPAVELKISGYHAPHGYLVYDLQNDDIKLDAAKRVLYLPVSTLSDTNI